MSEGPPRKNNTVVERPGEQAQPSEAVSEDLKVFLANLEDQQPGTPAQREKAPETPHEAAPVAKPTPPPTEQAPQPNTTPEGREGTGEAFDVDEIIERGRDFIEILGNKVRAKGIQTADLPEWKLVTDAYGEMWQKASAYKGDPAKYPKSELEPYADPKKWGEIEDQIMNAATLASLKKLEGKPTASGPAHEAPPSATTTRETDKPTEHTSATPEGSTRTDASSVPAKEKPPAESAATAEESAPEISPPPLQPTTAELHANPAEKLAPAPEASARRTPGLNMNTAFALSKVNASLWERMTDRGREILEDAYERAFIRDKKTYGKIAEMGPKTILGKFRIAYSSFWNERHEHKASDLKRRLEARNIPIKKLGELRGQILESIKEARESGMPGVELLELRVKNIEKKIADGQAETDRIQTKLEYRENRAKVRENERNNIADMLIKQYDRALGQIENPLASLESAHAELRFIIEKEKMNFEEEERRIAIREAKLDEWVRMCEDAGVPRREIRKDFEHSKKELEAERREMHKVTELRKRQLLRSRDRIGRYDDLANPMRDRRERIIRIKDRRVIEIEIPERAQGASDQPPPRKVSAHFRREAPPAPRLTERDAERSHTTPDAFEAFEQSEVERMLGPTFEDQLGNWLAYLATSKEAAEVFGAKGVDAAARSAFIGKFFHQNSDAKKHNHPSNAGFKSLMIAYYLKAMDPRKNTHKERENLERRMGEAFDTFFDAQNPDLQ